VDTSIIRHDYSVGTQIDDLKGLSTTGTARRHTLGGILLAGGAAMSTPQLGR
jgi:hypothetical protein